MLWIWWKSRRGIWKVLEWGKGRRKCNYIIISKIPLIPWPFKDKHYKVVCIIVYLSYFKNIANLVTRICLKCVLSYIFTISKYKKIPHPEKVFWYGNIIIHWSTLQISILNEKLASASNSHLTIKSGHSDIDSEFWNITFHHIMFQQNVSWHNEPGLNLDMNKITRRK